MFHLSHDAVIRQGTKITLTLVVESPDQSFDATGICHLNAEEPTDWGNLQSRVQFVAASLLEMTLSTLSDSELATLVRNAVK